MIHPLDETALKAAVDEGHRAFAEKFQASTRWDAITEAMKAAIASYLSALAPATRPQASDAPSTDPLASAIQTACNSAAKAPDEYCTWAMAVAAADGVRAGREASEEDVARAIWGIRREEEDRCDMELEDMGYDHSVWDEARAVLAIMPAAGWMAPPTGDR